MTTGGDSWHSRRDGYHEDSYFVLGIPNWLIFDYMILAWHSLFHIRFIANASLWWRLCNIQVLLIFINFSSNARVSKIINNISLVNLSMNYWKSNLSLSTILATYLNTTGLNFNSNSSDHHDNQQYNIQYITAKPHYWKSNSSFSTVLANYIYITQSYVTGLGYITALYRYWSETVRSKIKL